MKTTSKLSSAIHELEKVKREEIDLIAKQQKFETVITCVAVLVAAVLFLIFTF